MARPKRCRKVAARPGSVLFKPAGVPARSLAEIVLTVDEFESIRLADQLELYHEQAADRMGVSRQTFGRVVALARRKVATALVEGLAIRIEGGSVAVRESHSFACADCEHLWQGTVASDVPDGCPGCGSRRVKPT